MLSSAAKTHHLRTNSHRSIQRASVRLQTPSSSASLCVPCGAVPSSPTASPYLSATGPMKTFFVGALAKSLVGMLRIEAKTFVAPPATHSLRLTVVKSAWL